MVVENKNTPCGCTILSICGMIDAGGIFKDYYILWTYPDYDVEKVTKWLEKETQELIIERNEKFYLGGYGAFDRLAASVLADKKQRYLNIKLILVYLNRVKDIYICDISFYPPIESVQKKLAIIRRNQWMVDQADIVVSYVLHSWGGAAMMLEYAKRKKKMIL